MKSIALAISAVQCRRGAKSSQRERSGHPPAADACRGAPIIVDVADGPPAVDVLQPAQGLDLAVDRGHLAIVRKDEHARRAGERVSWFADSLEGVLDQDGPELPRERRGTQEQPVEGVEEGLRHAVVLGSLDVRVVLENVDDPCLCRGKVLVSTIGVEQCQDIDLRSMLTSATFA
jgi:hypothetical protein